MGMNAPGGPIGVWARMNLGDQWKERGEERFNGLSGLGPQNIPKPVLKWDQQDVLNWLDRVSLSVLKPHFQNHEITGDMLVELTNEDFEVEMEVTSGILRKKLIKEVETLKQLAASQGKDLRVLPSFSPSTPFTLSDLPRSPPAAPSQPPHPSSRKRSSSASARPSSASSSPNLRSQPHSPVHDSIPQDQQMMGPVLLSQAFVELFNNNMQSVESLLRALMGVSDQYRAQVKLLLQNLRRIDPACFLRLASFLFPNISVPPTQGSSTDVTNLPGEMMIESILRKLDPNPDHRPISLTDAVESVMQSGLPQTSLSLSSSSNSNSFHGSQMMHGLPGRGKGSRSGTQSASLYEHLDRSRFDLWREMGLSDGSMPVGDVYSSKGQHEDSVLESLSHESRLTSSHSLQSGHSSFSHDWKSDDKLLKKECGGTWPSASENWDKDSKRLHSDSFHDTNDEHQHKRPHSLTPSPVDDSCLTEDDDCDGDSSNDDDNDRTLDAHFSK
eukprot:c7238_g1_i3.p1 GENE.c7238_g1_i3~~c7238_g1_i3.p1  ORF type:complete len:515 (-),score=67.23 c7238_g1_i3:61-1557(-)